MRVLSEFEIESSNMRFNPLVPRDAIALRPTCLWMSMRCDFRIQYGYTISHPQRDDSLGSLAIATNCSVFRMKHREWRPLQPEWRLNCILHIYLYIHHSGAKSLICLTTTLHTVESNGMFFRNIYFPCDTYRKKRIHKMQNLLCKASSLCSLRRATTMNPFGGGIYQAECALWRTIVYSLCTECTAGVRPCSMGYNVPGYHSTWNNKDIVFFS